MVWILGAGLENNLTLNDSMDSGINSETQPLLLQEPPLRQPQIGAKFSLGSTVSVGSSGQQNGGIWGAFSENIVYGHAHQVQQPPQPLQQLPHTAENWDMPWTGSPSGGSGSNTTYGPAAPTPSASNYVTIPHGYPKGVYVRGGVSTESGSAYQPQTQSNLSSSGNC